MTCQKNELLKQAFKEDGSWVVTEGVLAKNTRGTVVWVKRLGPPGSNLDEDDLDEDSALGVEVQRRGITVECCQYEVDRSFECVPGARLLCSASSPPPLYVPACRL